MHIVSTQMTVADYCTQMIGADITVNKEYQRSDQVWPPAAKSFLIETVLLGYPIPKLSLHQVTSVRTKKTVKEIVDGQQRSQALREFFENKLRLSQNTEVEDAAGRRYDQLPEPLQGVFLAYSLSVDLFVSTSKEEVREVFRRMNSYNVPLNPEEQRHAQRQGPFKWFIHRLTRDYDELLVNMGVFRERQIIRMADAKLLTEVALATFRGIRTSSKKELDDLYKSRDEKFPEEEELLRRINRAMKYLASTTDLHNTPLMRPYQFYSLLLAVMHVQEPIPTLSSYVTQAAKVPDGSAIANLSALAEALEDETASSTDHAEFVKASKAGTNTETTRIARFKAFYSALTTA
jgi:hypothetical protein